MAKKKKGLPPEQVRQRITELESLFGQKETAKRLGVSPATLRKYKTGTPPKKPLTKLGRVYGQNKKKVDPEKVKRYEKNVATKQTARRKKLIEQPKLLATSKWVKSEFKEKYIVANVMQDTTEFVATLDGGMVQFMNANDLANGTYGIPKGTKIVTIYGLYNSNYNPEQNKDKMDYIASRFPIMLKREMNIEQALEYLEEKFFMTTKQAGKRRLNPQRFLGFRL